MSGRFVAFAGLLVALCAAACQNSSSSPEVREPPEARIHNGVEAGMCQWPNSVALIDGFSGGPYCTGTLIAPDVVLTAAHCTEQGGIPEAMGFGESAFEPARRIDVIGCQVHPEYYGARQIDLAVCQLSEPVTDVPIVPPLMGCELDAMQPGVELTIVGFGNTQTYYDPVTFEAISEGVGLKRTVEQQIYGIREDLEEIDMVGLQGDASACHGDSGGGAYIRLPDGTWRVFGVAQSLFVPPEGQGSGTFDETTGNESVGFIDETTGNDSVGFIDPTDGGTGGDEPIPGCGPGVTYSMIAPQMEWIESITGRDVSPCFDVDGTWNPNDACTPFSTDLELGGGAWVDGCVGAVGGEPQCGDLPEPDPEGSTGAVEPDTSTTAAGTTGEPDDSDDPLGTTTGEPEPRPTSSETDTGGASGAGGDAQGCGCSTRADPVGPLRGGLMALGLLWGLRRRRRR